MKLNKYMIAGGLSILLTGNFSSCSLDYEPLDTLGIHNSLKIKPKWNRH